MCSFFFEKKMTQQVRCNYYCSPSPPPPMPPLPQSALFFSWCIRQKNTHTHSPKQVQDICAYIHGVKRVLHVCVSVRARRIPCERARASIIATTRFPIGGISRPINMQFWIASHVDDFLSAGLLSESSSTWPNQKMKVKLLILIRVLLIYHLLMWVYLTKKKTYSCSFIFEKKIKKIPRRSFLSKFYLFIPHKLQLASSLRPMSSHFFLAISSRIKSLIWEPPVFLDRGLLRI